MSASSTVFLGAAATHIVVAGQQRVHSNAQKATFSLLSLKGVLLQLFLKTNHHNLREL
jgi:hypothetical protein